MNIEGLDALDNKILEVIRDNARLSYSDIGEKVGLSRVAVKNRMDNMEKSGIIKGYKTVIDPTKVPDGVPFIIDVETIPEQYGTVMDVLVNDRYMRQVYSTTGNCRIHAVGLVPNYRTLESHAKLLYNQTKGISRLSWHMLMSTYKDVDNGVVYAETSGLLEDK